MHEKILLNNMMGPNCNILLEELIYRYPISKNARILDLGCGRGLSTLFLMEQFPTSKIFSVDLWTSPSENARRFELWGIDENAIPMQLDANRLPFANEYFDLIVSIDAYQYFGRKKKYFENKLKPLLKNQGLALFAIPGLKNDVVEEDLKKLWKWAGDEIEFFKTCKWWKDNFCMHKSYIWEMESFESAWQSWFSTEKEVAKRDADLLKGVRNRCMNFIGVAVENT